MSVPPWVAWSQMNTGLNLSQRSLYPRSQGLNATMAKRYTLSELHAQEYSLSMRVSQKQEEYERRKERLLELKDELEAFRDDLVRMKQDLREMRRLIRDLEGE